MQTQIATRAEVRRRDERETFSLMGSQLSLVTTTEETGAYSVLEQRVAPQAGTPPHICLRDERVIHVVAGEFAVRIGDETLLLTDGDVALVPPGVVHNLRNVGDGNGRLLISMSPGGYERFLRALSRLARNGALTREAMVEIGRLHQVEVV